MNTLPLILIPLCSILNHEGGQNAVIPDPRIVFRVFGMAVAVAVVSLLAGLTIDTSWLLLGITLAGMALWAVFTWGNGFICLPPYIDNRDYTKLCWVCELCNMLLGVTSLSTLTTTQKKLWGILFLTIRGGFMYPMFITIAFIFGPMSLLVGLLCFTQGVVYWLSKTVYIAEFVFGGLIGAAFNVMLYSTT